ncbi:ribonuclease H-like domain-containing protein [Patescibacteria group bacterium]|nr:ribonuclease H-like domain-containing protein [Patescibacteria group bacterium]
MADRYSKGEDLLLLRGMKAGKTFRQIFAEFASKGYKRTYQSVKSRAGYFLRAKIFTENQLASLNVKRRQAKADMVRTAASKVKILSFDIETSPNKVWSWGIYEVTIGINQVIQEGYVLCWAAKWLGKSKMMSDAIINYPAHFKKDPTSDRKIAETMWKLLDEADIVITHNGDNFDIKWLNTIFLKHKMPPPSPYRSIDTLKASRGSFRFVSNKLAFILKSLGLSQKMENEGFGLWVKCMIGNKDSWKTMLKYCMQDVKSLEELYYEIRPYIKGHPNLALYQDESALVCTACGSKRIGANGSYTSGTQKYKRYMCLEPYCGNSFRGSQGLIKKKKGAESPRNI